MEYNYKLAEKINLTLEDIKLFLEAFNIQDFSKYNNTEFVNEDFNFNFLDESIISLFSTMLSLNHIWAIYLHIPYLWRDFPVMESSIDWNIQEYLYKNVDTYLSKIRTGDNGLKLRMWLALDTEDFILWFLQILYQEKDISLLENYKILNNIIKSIKSKADNNIIQKEIELFYDYELYKNNLFSIFPILVELSREWYLNIRKIKYEKWEIWFNLRILSELDNIDQEEIIELFWSEDLFIEKTKTKDLIFDWVKIISWTKNKILTGYKLKLAEYIFLLNKDESNYDWWILMEHIYWMNWIWDWMVNLVKKLNMDLKDIWSELRLWYSEWSHIYIKY